MSPPQRAVATPMAERRAARPCYRASMAITADQRRALEMLAGSPLGATEAIMLAHGFTNAMLDALVRDGLATTERRAMKAGRQPITVTWFAITDAGRQALAG
jgi:hypothetical protein